MGELYARLSIIKLVLSQFGSLLVSCMPIWIVKVCFKLICARFMLVWVTLSGLYARLGQIKLVGGQYGSLLVSFMLIWIVKVCFKPI